MPGLFKSKVTVTFINDDDDDVVAVSEIPADDLPETFLESTSLEIGETSWSVVSAEPPLRSDFAKTGKLTLRLTSVEMMPPEDILFSLPTIEDTIPACEGALADGSELVMLEDSWRQIEFVSRNFAGHVRQEIDSIAAIHEEANEGIAFSDIHVRQLIPFPMGKSNLTVNDLDGVFGPHSAAIRFHDNGARISDTTCHRLESGWVLYHHSSEDSVLALGMVRNVEEDDGLQARHIGNLSRISETNDLLLVDWCNCVIAEPGSDEFNAVFLPR